MERRCPYKAIQIIHNGRTIEHRDVVVLAVAGVWAMVRRPRCMPYVVAVRELVEVAKKPKTPADTEPAAKEPA